jgi:HSP20 family protein
MANLIRRQSERGGEREIASRRYGEWDAFRGWDPFRTMRELMGWDPFREPGRVSAGAGFAPDFDVRETKDAYVFTADLPGVKEEDLEVNVTQGSLTVSGHRATEQAQDDERYYCCERSYGEFRRTFGLPEGSDADAASADFRDGVLRITVRKRPEVQPRRVEIGSKQPGAKA